MTKSQSTVEYQKDTNEINSLESEATGKERQLLACEFDLLDPFLRSIEVVFFFGFSYETTKKPQLQIINEALRANPAFIGGIAPNLRINYHELVVSKGNLKAPVARLYQYRKTIARLKWDKTISSRQRRFDKVFWMRYNATTNETVVWEEEGVRPKGCFDIKMSAKILKDELHHWMFFTSSNGKQRSPSVYLGQLNTSLFDSVFYVNPPDEQ